jgi:hypothetical protein
VEKKKLMRHMLNGKYSPNKQVTVNVVDARGNLIDSFSAQGNVNELEAATSGYAPGHRGEALRLIGAANRRLGTEMIVDDCRFDDRNLVFTIQLTGKRRKNPSMFTMQNPEKHSFTTRRGKRKMATINQVLGMPTMWSDESIAHAERMADAWQMHANPSNAGGRRVTNARFAGRCAVTGEEYPVGTPIVKTEAGWAMAEHV